jgi:hypothetical protein
VPDSDGDLVPVGAVIAALSWWNRPDKYQVPAEFSTLKKARKYDSSGFISIKVMLRAPDQRVVEFHAAVSSVDNFVGTARRENDNGVPQVGSVVIEVVYNEYSDTCHEVVFRNPDGVGFVLAPLTTPAMWC